MLVDDWPSALVLVCPPTALTRAAMARTVYEYINGANVVFIGHEHLLDGALERTFARTLGIKKHLGTPVMEPYRQQVKQSYAVWLFLQPVEIARIDILKSPSTDSTNLAALWQQMLKDEDDDFLLERHDMAARMVWSGVRTANVRTHLNLRRLAKNGLMPRFLHYAALMEVNVPEHCAQNAKLA